MKTPMKVAAVAGMIGILALVAVAGAAVATGSMPGLSGSDTGNHMNGVMGCGNAGAMMNGNCQMSAESGAQCQSGNMQCMMNGNGQQCQNADMQAQMTQNADGTWNCPGCQDDQSRA